MTWTPSVFSGDSIVRDFLVFGTTEHVMEQKITVEIRPYENAWRAVVWLDHGRDLAESPRGPWWPTSGIHTEPPPPTHSQLLSATGTTTPS
ncbi:uncharacterized protein BJX67DRAFT_361419 [Aspergillus lucknowensis]|uniref:Uncharacterized protein n=1 Tax=Aspergillus lucknowensis TaxID=176173 RepID=A0ABR4LII8_9EURO